MVQNNEQFIEGFNERTRKTFTGKIGQYIEKAEDDKLLMILDITPDHYNGLGIVHGGVISTLIDDAMGAVAMLKSRYVVTINLDVRFLAPFKEGKIYARSEVVHQSRSMITTECKLYDEEGNLGATGTGTFKIINPKTM
ncbi:PaaI family thioesterase [Longirhabdus pacifica]|uniref:PaaI family thioesterase n=1 Tax=Longirhabdus pacifica TaxID=2305227 RepID=UPI001008AE8A|nr:PaaI family thioesterase [Longirhabdus pacifica]